MSSAKKKEKKIGINESIKRLLLLRRKMRTRVVNMTLFCCTDEIIAIEMS